MMEVDGSLEGLGIYMGHINRNSGVHCQVVDVGGMKRGRTRHSGAAPTAPSCLALLYEIGRSHVL